MKNIAARPPRKAIRHGLKRLNRAMPAARTASVTTTRTIRGSITSSFELLADALVAEQQRTGDFLEVGVAYVRFAVDHRAHFEVMFRPELYNVNDAGVEAARQHATEALYGGVESVPDEQRGDRDVHKDGVAAWSLVHGFATLWLNNALPPWLGEDPEAAARDIARLLFPSPSSEPTAGS